MILGQATGEHLILLCCLRNALHRRTFLKVIFIYACPSFPSISLAFGRVPSPPSTCPRKPSPVPCPSLSRKPSAGPPPSGILRSVVPGSSGNFDPPSLPPVRPWLALPVPMLSLE